MFVVHMNKKLVAIMENSMTFKEGFNAQVDAFKVKMAFFETSISSPFPIYGGVFFDD